LGVKFNNQFANYSTATGADHEGGHEDAGRQRQCDTNGHQEKLEAKGKRWKLSAGKMPTLTIK
jgi:hypothetical protein